MVKSKPVLKKEGSKRRRNHATKNRRCTSTVPSNGEKPASPQGSRRGTLHRLELKPMCVVMKQLTVKVNEEELTRDDLERMEVTVMDDINTDVEFQVKVKRQKMLEVIPARNMIITPMVPRLPPEMWDKILSYVTNGNDLVNCCKAAPVLSRGLNDRKPVFLFQDVFPLLFPYLPLQDVLNMRPVCRQWQRGIDRQIEYPSVREAYYDPDHLEAMESLPLRKNMGCSRSSRFNPWTSVPFQGPRTHDFLEYADPYEDLGRSPFFGQSLEFTVDRTALVHNPIVVNARIFAVMARFGQDVQHLRLNFTVTTSYDYFVCTVLTSWVLSYTPNLRSLSVIINGMPELFLQGLWVSAYCGDQLPYLENIELLPHNPLMTPRMLSPFCRRYYNQITRLSLPYWPAIAEKMPCLRELKLGNLISNQEMTQLRYIDAPILEKVTLCFDNFLVDASQLNLVLGRYPELRVLALEWKNTVYQPFLSSIRTRDLVNRQIPTLHTLYIQHGKNINYSILGRFPNLRFLYLIEMVPEGTSMDEETPPEAGKVWMPEGLEMNMHRDLWNGNMERSNIWRVMRKLKFIAYYKVRPQSLEELKDSLVRPWQEGNGQQEIIRRYWERPQLMEDQ